MIGRSTKAGALAPATQVDRGLVGRYRVRSTKAGALAPATQPRTGHALVVVRTLNKGRSVSSGDTFQISDPGPLHQFRSTKAGALAPATRQLLRGSWPEPTGRSVSSGDTTPGCLRDGLSGALNKGRSVSSGDTPRQEYGASRPGARSTKAGALAPATPSARHRLIASFQRSTKAGALAPATHCRSVSILSNRNSLNEGRSVSSGDTGC